MARGSLLRMVYRRFTADLAGSLPLRSRLLDVGTGPGYLLGHLSRQRPDLDLWGLDLAAAMIRRAARQPPGSSPPGLRQWLVADAQALPFPESVFDQVLATFSCHSWPQPVTGLTEMVRVLKPGGRAWIYELNRDATPRNVRAFAREERLPFPLAYLGFLATSRHHAYRTDQFARVLSQAAGAHWRLSPAHHLFWRGELMRE